MKAIACHDDFWRQMAADPVFRQQMIDVQRNIGGLKELGKRLSQNSNAVTCGNTSTCVTHVQVCDLQKRHTATALLRHLRYCRKAA